MANDRARAVSELLDDGRKEVCLADRIPALMPTRRGGLAVPFDAGTALLMCTYLPGETPTSPSRSVVRQSGEILACLHQLSASLSYSGYKEMRGRDLATSAWYQAMDAALHKASLTAEERRLARRCVESVRRLESRYLQLPRIVLHGDVTMRNLAIREGKIGLFDFGGALVAPRLFDVQASLANLAGRTGTFQADLVDAFMTSYSAVWPLQPAEWSLLKVVMAADLARIIAWLADEGQQRMGSLAQPERAYRLSLLRDLHADVNY